MMLTYLVLVLFSSTQDISLNNIKEIRNNVNRIYDEYHDEQDLKHISRKYGAILDNQDILSLKYLINEMTKEGRDCINPVKYNIMINAYASHQYQYNVGLLKKEIIDSIEKIGELSQKRGFQKILDGKNKDDKFLISNYIYLHYLLRAFVDIAYKNNDLISCYQTALPAIESPFIYLRNLGSEYIQNLLCVKKLNIEKTLNLKNKLCIAKENEMKYTNFENIDKLFFDSSQKSIMRNLEAAIDCIQD